MKLVRLSSGEEIIGNVKKNKDNSVTITNGYSLIPAGEGKIGFMPFMAYTEAANGITIAERFILFMVEPNSQLAEQIKQMDSKIVVPPQGIITGV
jgi:hypothetical protein|tara:strand:+ start:570 stop:854 length:285 start_codon:yes stop_codon:yes gene_type:complete